MKYYNFDRNKPIEKALRMVGLKDVFMEKHGKKMVITVTRYGQPEKRYLFAKRDF